MEIVNAKPPASGDATITTKIISDLEFDDDVNCWWNSLSTILKNCFTSTRVGLEVRKEDEHSFLDWTISSTADLLSCGDAPCRDQVLQYVCDELLGIRILLQLMEDESQKEKKKRMWVAKILRESVNPKNGKFRSLVIKRAIAADYMNGKPQATQVIFIGLDHDGNFLPVSVTILKDLIHKRHQTKLTQDVEIIENTTVDFVWFFSAVATNDSTFATTVRKMLKVKFFHNEVFKKIFFAKSTAHYPLLKILRQLARNELTSEILGKEGVMSTLRKVTTVVGNSASGKLLIIIDILAQLTKKRMNSVRIQRAGLITKLSQYFSNWELWRGKGLVRLSKFILTVFSHVSLTKNGRKTIVNSDAILYIRKFCDNCPSERAFDDIVMKCAGLVSTCYKKDSLPIENIESPITFQRPDMGPLDKPLDGGSSSDDEGSEDEKDGDNESIESEGVYDGDPHASDDDGNTCSDDDLEKDTEKIEAPSSTLRIGPLGDNFQSSNTKFTENLENDSTKLKDYEKFFQEFEFVGGQLINRKISNRGTPLESIFCSILDANSNETCKNKQTLKSEHRYPWILEQKDCKYSYWTSMEDMRKKFMLVANSVNRVSQFVKIAYPEIAFSYSGKSSEYLQGFCDRVVLRSRVNQYISRTVGIETFKPKVVYFLDALLKKQTTLVEKEGDFELKNTDEKQANKFNFKLGLQFEARFESGNLRKAIQIGEREYDLIITSDVNSQHHCQWFYFQASNMVNDKSYTFNILNCTKSNSLFNYGMQPVVFSVMEAMKGKPGWIRSGAEICYFKNGYKCDAKKRSVYHTLSFTLTFPHKGDIVYIAYCIPYTYTRMMVELDALIRASESFSHVVVKYDKLCQTLNNNEVPLLTITSPFTERQFNNREIILLTSRVHPGETNASWIMKGILEFLTFGNTLDVKLLLSKYVFKIVPMLNVEGVINGCHRYGLTSEDLNRCWKSPSEILHPTIYHTKMLIEYSSKCLKLPPVLYVDLHGHSRRKNLFLYGCLSSKSWNAKDKLEADDADVTSLLSLPESMSKVSSAFCLNHCNYDVKKNRETTARVCVWRDYKILRSYTLECSYCGCDRGPYKGNAFGTYNLIGIGKDLCKAIALL